MDSSNVRKHAIHLTEAIKELQGDTRLDPAQLGVVLRLIQTGLERTTLAIAEDENISYEESGRLLTVIALLHKGVADSFGAKVKNPSGAPPKLSRT